MDFRAIQVLCMTVSTLMEEIPWGAYGSEQLHTPVLTDEKDCYHLDMLLDVMGTLTRMMDTRIAFVTSEGKVIREWIEAILEIGERYRRELLVLKQLESEAPISVVASEQSE